MPKIRKIILASRSKARQKLLKQIGLKFLTVNPNIKEMMAAQLSEADVSLRAPLETKLLTGRGAQATKQSKKIASLPVVARNDTRQGNELSWEGSTPRPDCGDLVVANALAKAKAAAKDFSSGVVIGADTLVLAGKRIIGKPENMGDAFKTLKLLSRAPQLVYTGIAVEDIDRKKTFTDFEMTKIYMYRLTDKQIRNYFKKVSPLDKAGSFDIQGLGSIFIDRIEGCFYNVVGLPLAKLAKLLKKAGVDVF